MSGRDTGVLMRLVVDGMTDVLGCHIVGDSAAETIQAVAIAVKMKRVGRVEAEGVTRHLPTRQVKRPPREFCNRIPSFADGEEAGYAFSNPPRRCTKKV